MQPPRSLLAYLARTPVPQVQKPDAKAAIPVRNGMPVFSVLDDDRLAYRYRGPGQSDSRLDAEWLRDLRKAT
jgi:hypothetical protein